MNDQDDFGYYHPEKEEVEEPKTNFRTSHSTDYKSGPSVFKHNTAAMWGWDDSMDWVDYGDIKVKEEEIKPLKCQCGSDAVKATRHSDYCPKYKEQKDE
jgi:hypothetical protein